MLVPVEPFSLYFHIPFCRHRCGYCDFNTTAGLERMIPAYIKAIKREIEQVSNAADKKISVHTIFFGGGTPSLVPAEDYRHLWQAIRSSFEILEPVEVTLEANPGTVSLNYLAELRKLGFNRISFGMQSAVPEELRLLERQHDISDVIDAVKWARMAGFESISLDLILGLPGQSLEHWQHNVRFAADLNCEHLSLYALTIEQGTPMHRWQRRGLIPELDEDLSADMYEWASEYLESVGFEQYEISNWARHRDGKLAVCKHNLQYWRNLPYLGFGAGAHGYASGMRTENIPGLAAFIDACMKQMAGDFPAGPAVQRVIPIDRWSEIEEHMMVGLRLTDEGVSRTAFETRFGIKMERVFNRQIQKLLTAGLLEWSGATLDRLRLTKRGRLVANQVFLEFVGNPNPL